MVSQRLEPGSRGSVGVFRRCRCRRRTARRPGCVLAPLTDERLKPAAPCRDPYLTAPAYAPVSGEVHEAELEVIEGALPPGLSGAYVRTGPNPALPVEGGYHVRLLLGRVGGGWEAPSHQTWEVRGSCTAICHPRSSSFFSRSSPPLFICLLAVV